MFSSSLTTLISTNDSSSRTGNYQLEFAQIDTFLAHLRKMSGDSEEDRDSSQETRAERDAVQRQKTLHESLFELVSPEGGAERRRELNKIADQKELNLQEQDSSLEKRLLNEQLDEQSAAAAAVANPGAIAASLSGGEPVATNMVGLAQAAAIGSSFVASNGGSNQAAIANPLPQAQAVAAPPVSVAVVASEQQTVQAQLKPPVETAALTTGPTAVQPKTSVQSTPQFSPNGNPALEIRDPNTTPRQLSLLASYSDISGALTGAVRNVRNPQTGEGKQVSRRFGSDEPDRSDSSNGWGASDKGSKPATLPFADLLEFPETAPPKSPTAAETELASGNDSSPEQPSSQSESSSQGERSSSENGIPLDSNWLEQKPQKAVPSFVSALDHVLASRNRRRFSAEETAKEALAAQSQFRDPATTNAASVNSAANASAPAAREKPMLEQIDRVRLVQRVANACQSAANQSGTIRMKLHPEALGSLSLKIQVKNKTFNAQIETETESAKTVLLENLDGLRERLAEQGIRLESFEVVNVGPASENQE